MERANPQIALETMAGKGTEIYRTFDELAAIIDGVTLNDKLSVTLDTCHINDAGYNVKDDFDGVLVEFDKIIGLDRLKVIHVNDSKILWAHIKIVMPILALALLVLKL